MTSASTKRRHKNADAVRKSASKLQQFCLNWLDGVDGNIRMKRQAAARTQVDVVRAALADLPGLVEDALDAGAHHSEKEIQRLRTAMVLAMADCEAALHSGAHGLAYTYVTKAHAELKTALEKK